LWITNFNQDKLRLPQKFIEDFKAALLIASEAYNSKQPPMVRNRKITAICTSLEKSRVVIIKPFLYYPVLVEALKALLGVPLWAEFFFSEANFKRMHWEWKLVGEVRIYIESNKCH
jgi:hypothetical protein